MFLESNEGNEIQSIVWCAFDEYPKIVRHSLTRSLPLNGRSHILRQLFANSHLRRSCSRERRERDFLGGKL